MSTRLIVSVCTVGILFVFAVLTRGEVKGPQSYACAYQNITSDRALEGFIQFFACAINKTQIYILGDNKTYSNSKVVSMAGLGQENSFNFTPLYSDALLKADPVSVGSPQISNFGIIASSDQPAAMIAGKSDLGTSDAYNLLPQTNNSVEFMIVSWPRIQGRPFLAMVMAIPVMDGTCVELYKIFYGNFYQLVTSEIVGKFQVFRYFAAFETYLDNQNNFLQNFTMGEDTSGFYLNATHPVQVIVGIECGWVPTPSDLFCDYMADTMPPKNHLGKVNIFGPIYGRNPKAGYIGRVVASVDNTKVTIGLNPPVTVTIRLGGFYQFDAPDATQPTVVTCDKPCLCAQYNKGYLDYDDVPTDPYMVTIVPVDRYTAGAPFGTASFCEDKNELIDFDNYISIVTYDAYKDNILYDGGPISDQFSQAGGSGGWISVMAGGEKMAVAGFGVDPGFHFVSMSAGMDGSFVVYVYGHSLDPDSSSGYGYFANFNSTGEGVTSSLQEAKKIVDQNGGSPDRNTTCNSEAYLVGSIISSQVGQYVPFPFFLTASINPGTPLTPACYSLYHDELLKLLQDFSRKINYWICISQNCSFLGGQGVAINYNTLQVDYQGTNGIYTSATIYVEMIASFDVSAENFAQCRAEIQNYMYYFINWPPLYSPNLLHQIVGPGCPSKLPFQQPMFTAVPVQCPKFDQLVITS